MNIASRVPIIIGVGQITDKESEPTVARSPLELMVDATKIAGQDARANVPMLSHIDSIAVIRSFSDTVPAFHCPFGRLANAPWSVGRRIGADPREFIYPPQGGDVPQLMVNRACDQIGRGEISSALIVGAEAQRTERNAKRAGLELDWSEDAPVAPDELGGASKLYTQTEIDHGMRSATVMYALFEQALRGRKGLTIEQRSKELGQLFAGFAEVAHDNHLATRNEGYSADDIRSVSAMNRYVGFPYTRLMTANIYVDQAAAIILCSEAKADEWGVPEERRVHLLGSASGHDEWFSTERNQFDRSPAINRVARATLDCAGIDIDQVSSFDLYSCFASAVEIACNEIGLSTSDPRKLTVTGGLSFFGGPGNNYVTHSIAETVNRVREKPGSYGMITGNGGLLTKQSAGIYSTKRSTQPWRPADEESIQSDIDVASGPKVQLNPAPDGEAIVETYTILHERGGPERGIVVGRLKEGGSRFVANTPGDPETLAKLEEIDMLGMTGTVTSGEKSNLFVLHA